MKKISKNNFQGLNLIRPEQAQQSMASQANSASDYYEGYYYGGKWWPDPFGTGWCNGGYGFIDSDGNYNWFPAYSVDEYENWQGEWPGGWVYGIGYVGVGPYIEATPYFNIYAAAKYLTEHALDSYSGNCAKYVRWALEAGGFDTSGHPFYAEGYDTFLIKNGFTKIDPSSTPQMGDIVVFEPVDGHEAGHIAMYNGKIWISDFKQDSMFVASEYLNGEYTMLRWTR